MRRVIFIAALIALPGAAVVGAGWLAYRWVVRRTARHEVFLARPRKEVRA